MTEQFILYVEGPRDREILSIFAKRESRELSKGVNASAIILGGRQPLRARNHFKLKIRKHESIRALCILDRDDPVEICPDSETGLEFFVWRRRHIESYLLVPRALAFALASRETSHELEKVIKREIPSNLEDEDFETLDAKRLLGVKGPIARVIGKKPDLGRIARNIRTEELHPDVVRVLEKIRLGLNISKGDVIHRGEFLKN